MSDFRILKPGGLFPPEGSLRAMRAYPDDVSAAEQRRTCKYDNQVGIYLATQLFGLLYAATLYNILVGVSYNRCHQFGRQQML